MTINDFLIRYNLHDCEICEIEQSGKITSVTFCLPRYLQSEKLNAEFSEFDAKEFPFIKLSANFSGCKNFIIKEFNRDNKSYEETNQVIDARVLCEEFISDEVVISEENTFDAIFSNKDKIVRFSFEFEEVCAVAKIHMNKDC